MTQSLRRLNIEFLEDRLTPTLHFIFDYRFDSTGFFNDATRRAALEQVGNDLGSRIDSHLQAITPSGGNTWSAMIFNPSTGAQSEIANINIPEDTVTIFVGARNLSGAEAGEGGTGGYRVGGSSSWFSTIANRGAAFSIWGGSVSFDTDQNWYFGSTASGLTSSNLDFYTVATHELGHVLGFGTATQFDQFISGRSFTGSHAVTENAGVKPGLSSDLSHWAQGTNNNGEPTSMQPYLLSARRYGYSDLDYAALADIGWVIGTDTTPVSPPVNVITPPATGVTAPISTHTEPIVLTGTNDGLARIVRYMNGSLVSDDAAIRPFSDYYGVLRSITADVTGDGITDIVFATGAGGPSRIAIIDGATGYTLITPLAVFGNDFTGGLYLATADFNGDGKDDIVVSPDRGGGGRVSVFRYTDHAVIRVSDFFGIDDVNFRGGARVAAADLNGDGTPDLIVGAGFGGGPRVALFDGRSLSQSKPTKFVGDFFAFPGDASTKLRNGVYLTAGDINGDGKADLIFGAGPGGGPQVYALSGAKLLAGDVAGAQKSPLVSFFAFSIEDRGGVRVSLKDVNNDGKLDLIAGSGSTGSLAWFNNANPLQSNLFDALGFQATADGIYVG
ncbi:hypothetical protein BH11PLA2_BH11PLA2_05530 [soil metagenome]